VFATVYFDERIKAHSPFVGSSAGRIVGEIDLPAAELDTRKNLPEAIQL
jgi:hypothetical protein